MQAFEVEYVEQGTFRYCSLTCAAVDTNIASVEPLRMPTEGLFITEKDYPANERCSTCHILLNDTARAVQARMPGKALVDKTGLPIDMDLIRLAMTAVSQQPQKQYSTDEQLAVLQIIANRLGLYDAADYIQGMLGWRSRRA